MNTPLAQLTVLPRAIVIGAVLTGVVGSFAGLIVGLFTYAPTAAFAVIEVGLPATIAGAIIGLVVGSLILTFRRLARLFRSVSSISGTQSKDGKS